MTVRCEIVAGVERSRGLTSPPQAAQAPESRGDPREAQHHPGRHRGISAASGKESGILEPSSRGADDQTRVAGRRRRRRWRLLTRRDLVDARLDERQRQADRRAARAGSGSARPARRGAAGGWRQAPRPRESSSGRPTRRGWRARAWSFLHLFDQPAHGVLVRLRQLASFARCTSSGAAAPSKTRSRKSRTIAPTTCWAGFAGRYS